MDGKLPFEENINHEEINPRTGADDQKERLPGIFSLPPEKRLLHGLIQAFLLMLVASLVYWSYPQGKYLPASGKTVFGDHQYWRLVTSLFVHGDMAHLLANGWIFILFGWMLRSYFGLLAFPLLSFAGGIISSGVTIFFYPPEVRLIGASGMVHVMVALWVTWYMIFDRERSIGQRLLRGTGFSLAMLVPAVVKPEVSYLAHGTGFIAGLVLALLLLPVAWRRVERIEDEIKRIHDQGTEGHGGEQAATKNDKEQEPRGD